MSITVFISHSSSNRSEDRRTTLGQLFQRGLRLHRVVAELYPVLPASWWLPPIGVLGNRAPETTARMPRFDDVTSNDDIESAVSHVENASALPLGAFALSSVYERPASAAEEVLRETLNVGRDLTTAELIDVAHAYAALLWRLLERSLGLSRYEYADHPPPHDTSPCGVLRLAVPETPRGPELPLHVETDPTTLWAQAA